MNVKPKEAPAPAAYQVNDFCAIMAIGRTNFYKLVKSGKIRTVMIGGRRVVPAGERDRLLSSNTDVSRAAA